jgi:tol-pal system protein YbgF
MPEAFFRRLLFVVAMSLLAFLAPARDSIAVAQDAAELTVRTARLENQLRQLAGQIEQLQFENRRLTEQLRKFQEEVDFRLNEKTSSRPSSAPANPATPGARQRRGDAYDPDAQPGGAGAPRSLGTLGTGSAPLTAGGPNGTGGSVAIIDDGTASGGPLDLNGVARPIPGGVLPANPPRVGQSVAATTTGTPKELYDAAFSALQRKEYERSEMAFRQFLQTNPRDPRVADATYWLGETYLQRQRYRESAEQFLKVSRDFPRTSRAPDSLLKLGISLNGLGARDQACATYAKVGVDYPEVSTALRQSVEREQRRARCS